MVYSNIMRMCEMDVCVSLLFTTLVDLLPSTSSLVKIRMKYLKIPSKSIIVLERVADHELRLVQYLL